MLYIFSCKSKFAFDTILLPKELFKNLLPSTFAGFMFLASVCLGESLFCLPFWCITAEYRLLR